MATGESESSWTEYSPGPYVLNFDVLASLTVQLRNEPPAVSQTLLAVVDRLRPKNPPDSGWRSLTVDTADGRHVIEGDGFCRNLLEILFEVHAKGGNALFSTWFYYDRDNTCRDDTTPTRRIASSWWTKITSSFRERCSSDSLDLTRTSAPMFSSR
jgi:hypothetical protein